MRITIVTYLCLHCLQSLKRRRHIFENNDRWVWFFCIIDNCFVSRNKEIINLFSRNRQYYCSCVCYFVWGVFVSPIGNNICCSDIHILVHLDLVHFLQYYNILTILQFRYKLYFKVTVCDCFYFLIYFVASILCSLSYLTTEYHLQLFSASYFKIFQYIYGRYFIIIVLGIAESLPFNLLVKYNLSVSQHIIYCLYIFSLLKCYVTSCSEYHNLLLQQY